ncbi:hypothetical protein MKW92_004512, partial [Papaver armeniacum]
EKKVFKQLFYQTLWKVSFHFFFAQHAMSKVPNVTDGGVKLRHIKKVDLLSRNLATFNMAFKSRLLKFICPAQAILDLMTVGKAIKKVPVIVENRTSFAVNRTFFPYGQGAHVLVHLGVDLFRSTDWSKSSAFPLDLSNFRT